MKLKRRVVENSVKDSGNVLFFPDSPERKEKNKVKDFEELSVEPCVLDSLITKANDIWDNSEDFTVEKANNTNVRFNDNAGITFQTADGVIHNSPISRFALSQLGVKIGVPARYLEKCVASGRINLAQDNVNSWLEDYNKDIFFRTYKGNIRGVLSSKYSVCDSHEILQVIDDAVDLSTYKIKGQYLSPERLHVRLVSKEMLPIEGEDLFAGLFIDSSDVGRSILTVQFGIYKQVCTNGLVVSKAGGVLFKQKHIGISTDEFHEGLIKSLANIDLLTENAIEWVNFAKTKNVYGYNVKSLSKEEMDEFVARIKAEVSLPEESAIKVVNLMQTKYDTSRWGFINGITEVAQDFTLDRRIELERYAGNLLIA